MSSEWVVTKLSTLGTFERGKSKHRPRDAAHLYGGPYPFIQTGDVTSAGGRITSYRQSYSEAGLAQSRLWPTGTLAITIAANIAETALLTFPACFPDSVVGFTATGNKADVRFIEYLFRAMRERVQRRAYGSVQENINLEVLRDLEFATPPLATQITIADFLSLLDDRIALLRETNVTLEAIAQTLFKSWFVDFDPVRAKSQGLAPAGMDEATAALFPDSFEESALGLVPKGWPVQPVGDVVECVGGATPDTKDATYWSPEEHSWTTPKDLSGLPTPALLRTERRLSAKGLAKVGSGLLPVGTLLMSSRAPIGYLAMAQIPVAINQGYIAMPPGSLLPPLYMLFWCQQNMEGIKARANGSTFMEISKKAFRPISAVVPSAPVIDAFLAIASPLFARLVANEQQAQTLATLRDTLLPRLISGQLRLPKTNDLRAEATA
jgi:type I restriction enzyme, S subunit